MTQATPNYMGAWSAPYVYVIAYNDEDGIKPPWFATLNRSRVIDLFQETFDASPYEDREQHIDPMANLTALLTKSDEELWSDGGRGIMPGWGGPTLYVLRLS